MKGMKHDYNQRKEIEFRLDRAEKYIKTPDSREKNLTAGDHISRETKEKSLGRAREFMNLNIAESKVVSRIKNLENKLDNDAVELTLAKQQHEKLKQLRKELGYEHDIIITEHALLRYIERFIGIDLDQVYKDILKLPKKEVTKFGNTIVTVYPSSEPREVIEQIAKDEAGILPKHSRKNTLRNDSIEDMLEMAEA